MSLSSLLPHPGRASLPDDSSKDRSVVGKCDGSRCQSGPAIHACNTSMRASRPTSSRARKLTGQPIILSLAGERLIKRGGGGGTACATEHGLIPQLAGDMREKCEFVW